MPKRFDLRKFNCIQVSIYKDNLSNIIDSDTFQNSYKFYKKNIESKLWHAQNRTHDLLKNIIKS